MDPAAASAQPNGEAFFRDGLGDRRLIRDATGQLRELLCIRADLSRVPSFEFALRERVGRLSGLSHPAFAAVRAVERVADAAVPLGLLSDRYNGIRLSQLLARAASRGIRINLDAAVYLTRQLVAAMARMHESYRELSHGALGPERTILAANGRLMIAEYTLATALEQLRYTQDRYWSELRLPVTRVGQLPRFDQRTDVLQCGLITLALILGRTLREDEFPTRIGDVVAAAWAVVPQGGFEPVPPPLRAWLVRALQLEGRQSFPTAIAAQAELESLVERIDYPGTPESVDDLLARYRAAEPVPAEIDASLPLVVEPFIEPEFLPHLPAGAGEMARPPGSVRIEDAMPEPPLSPPPPPAPPSRVPVVPTGEESGLDAFQSEADPPPPPARAIEAEADFELVPSPATEFDENAPLPEIAEPAALVPSSHRSPAVTGRWMRDWRFAAAGLAIVTLALTVVAAGRLLVPTPPATGVLIVNTVPAGAAALVDGTAVGATPLTLTLAAGRHTIELRGNGAPRVLMVTMAPGAQVEQYIELPAARMAPADEPVLTTGWLTLRTPVELQVYEGTRLIGSTAAGRLTLAVGAHTLTLRNDRLGFRTTRQVAVAAGKSTTVSVSVPNGTVAVNALPWAEVWVDGRRVGQTPVDLTIAIGNHEIVLRHPELGDHRQQVTISLNRVTRVSADLRRP